MNFPLLIYTLCASAWMPGLRKQFDEAVCINHPEHDCSVSLLICHALKAHHDVSVHEFIDF